MRALVQRVLSASVDIGGRETAGIGRGALVLLGVASGDAAADAGWLAGKVSRLRIFDDGQGRMSLPIADIGGSFLVVSQFTLLADCRKGNRPSYLEAAAPEKAVPLYEEFVRLLRGLGHDVQTGVFRESMQIRSINDGPVTILVDTPPAA
jgi:D-tyrosyl-tRNA(Tyr) deacylase